MVPRWQTHVPFYRRFIDDVIGIWLNHPDPEENARLWKEFHADMNAWHGLEWECTTPSYSITFMDLNIKIVGTKVETSIYEKPQNLYLYIPPHSSHPRGVLNGLVFGQILRVRRLCTRREDADTKIREFFDRLLARGHTRDKLLPIFARAEENASEYINRTPAEKEARRQKKLLESQSQIYFHLQFHPEDPPSRDIQKLWKEHVANPSGDVPLQWMENHRGDQVGFSKLVVAYSRPLNLRNRFSVRNIDGRGRNVSSYLAK